MTNEQKKHLLLDLIKIEENGEIFNFTRAKRAEFQKWVDGLIEQEPRWIPVSERLPNWDINCLVTDEDGEYGVGYYREDVHAWDSPNWGWIERKDRVDNKEAFTEPCGIGKVIAWMPLPKPYKAESEDIDENSD